jgi:hypothetical protein
MRHLTGGLLIIEIGPWSNCVGLPQNFTPQSGR